MAPGRPSRLVSAVDFVAMAGHVLFAWFLVLLAENLFVGAAHRVEFSAGWELHYAHSEVTWVALAALLPAAFAATAAGGWVARDGPSRPAVRAGAAVTVAAGAAVVALFVSTGRHLASWALRGPFVVALAAACGAATCWMAARVDRVPWARRWPGALAWCAAACLWVADARVLPQLYPAFHMALAVLVLACAAVGSTVWSTPMAQRTSSREAVGVRAVGLTMVLAGLASAALAPSSARRLHGADNLRRILVEHAPLLGRAVEVAAVLAPPAALDDASTDGTSSASVPSVGEIPRALDWTGHDVLLLSVDALRADHVSAYGYARETTPRLDALAKQGTLFESAYCPTPHTSYSITSMMTGKAMRPLLTLGLGQSSETWAAALRRYGYRTAAFYPPAVFYIDEERFRGFEASGFDFEYRRVEFSPASARIGQVTRYLASAPAVPVFLWVHLFEPHEPYESHDGHAFGPLPVDAYDSEVAEADAAIGAIAAAFRAARPGGVVLVTADHGEEFGEHGGHYHGTSCYEEQVHVPLVVVGPGVAVQRARTVVQTIDLMPTVLSALGIPRPARVRGRDLGPILAHGARQDPGFAYTETDAYTMVARGDDRLVCARKVAACSLFDVARDPGELHDIAPEERTLAAELRAATAQTERDQGTYEEGGGAVLPEALRRGLQGDVDAASDVAVLLDDAKLALRQKAAAVLFRLRSPATAPSVRRALQRDEDALVRGWCALTLVRIGEPVPPEATALFADTKGPLRRAAALALAERGDARGAGELAAWWADAGPPKAGLDLDTAKDVLAAMARIRDTEAVPALLQSLGFVALRPWIVDALGTIGDERARERLLEAFRDERYVTARPREAEALLRLGARDDLLPPLARFAGVADPMTEAIGLAYRGKLLAPSRGGLATISAQPSLRGDVSVPQGRLLRLWVLGSAPGAVHGTADGRALGEDHGAGTVHWVELEPLSARALRLDLSSDAGVLAAWVVPHAAEVPPPPPEPFDAGAGDDAAPPDGGWARAMAEGDASRPEHLN